MGLRMRQLPPLSALVAFEVAARHLSFTKAASDLNMTQGAISKQIINLEYTLGVKLFHRKTRSLELTEVGEAFWPQVREAVELLEKAVTSLKPDPDTALLEVRVPPTLAMRWVIPRLQAFRHLHPKIDVRLRTSLGATLAEFNLNRDQIDIAIVRLRKDGREEVPLADFLMDDDHVVACNANLAETIQTPTDLSGQTLLHAITRRHAWKGWLEAVGERSVDPDQGLHFDHYHFALQAAADGVGIVVAPYPLVQAYIASGQLVVPFDIAVASGSAYYLVYDKRKAKDRNVRAFRNWIVDAAQSMKIPHRLVVKTDEGSLESFK